MTRAELVNRAEQLAALLYPRRCPLCGAVLGDDALFAATCPDCKAEEERLRHTPPRLPDTEHIFYAVSGAACAYYYADSVRAAILTCKGYDHPWYARELADLMAVHIWGAAPAPAPGQRPQQQALTNFPQYHAVVPVPPRQPQAGVPSLPLLLAKRLGLILNLPVETPLHATRIMLPQKQLSKADRLQNTKDAYACYPQFDYSGKRLLLVDDVITTGATVSACAKALLAAGAVDVFAAGIAADEELPKHKRKKDDTP